MRRWLLILAATFISGVTGGGIVHQFEVRQRELVVSDDAAAANHLSERRLPRAYQQLLLDGDSARNKLSGVHAISANATKTWILVGGASLGTPAQTFTVGFLPTYGDTYFVGKDAQVTNVSRLSSIKRYDQSASTTAVNDGRNFTTDYNIVSGHIITDLLAIGDTQVNVRVGIADSVNRFALLGEAGNVDGFIGLSPSGNSSDCFCWGGQVSNVSVVPQIAKVLDKPLLSTYVNRSSRNPVDWTGLITIGAEDDVNCVAGSYSYTAQINKQNWNDLAVTSISQDATSTWMALTGTVELYASYAYALSLTDSVYHLLINATGATWHWQSASYNVDCSTVAAQPSFTLHLGYAGTAPVTLFPTDYIHYSKLYDLCYLNIHNSYKDDSKKISVTLGTDFHNSHCVALNIKSHTTGIAKVRQPPVFAAGN